MQNPISEKTAELDVWYEGHKNECNINHSGSSGAMEVQAATELLSHILMTIGI